MSEHGLSGLFTYASPFLIVLFAMCCLLRVFLRWTVTKKLCSTRSSRLNEHSTVCSNVTNSPQSMIAAHTGHEPPSLPVVPFEVTEYDGQTFYTVPFVISSFPPKYEDAVKMPTARRASDSGLLPPPPLYGSAQASSFHESPPSYWTLPHHLGSVQNLPSSSQVAAAAADPKPHRAQTAVVRHVPLTQSLSDSAQVRPGRPFSGHVGVAVLRAAPPAPSLPGAVAEAAAPQLLRVQDLEKE